MRKLEGLLGKATDLDIFEDYKVAILVPCYNEEIAIPKVVESFHAALPSATIYVYDNNSNDRTVEVARAAGATVRREPRQGKGHVVRRMFANVDADIYVLVDGDATYDASSVRRMIERLIDDNLDMVVAARTDQGPAAYRLGHRMGNCILTKFISTIFGSVFSDILSGYRVFTRRFVKSFPVLSRGFEIETELSVHALELNLPVAELDTPYCARLQGSASKLSTYRDGARILWTIVRLFKSERPFVFFAMISVFLMVIAVALAMPIFITYLEQGLVPRLPTAILTASLIVIAFLSFTCGLVLETVTKGRREMKMLFYLNQQALKNGAMYRDGCKSEVYEVA